MTPHPERVKLKRFSRWLRTFHTIRHLQPRQAWYFFLRRGVGARSVKTFAGEISCRDAAIHSALELQHADGGFSTYEFTFLNRSLSFPIEAMNWCPREAQRLWRYNLHYFDFLRETTRPLQQKIALIDDWIANNPQGSEPAWEPYTASLRIVNWCLFFWSLPREKIKPEWLRSLNTQARWLERNLELHILANHYFENIKAMLFAALFFEDGNSARWLSRFQKELIAQLREQTLKDGGHYERSPQYHCILLEDYLDIYALLRENSTFIKPKTLAALEQTINGGLHFLAAIATPDDDIPLFNDSASGSASPPSALFAKARALKFTIEAPQQALIDLPESGLFGWKSGSDYFLIDCGDIGPAYQPGHTHCDFLSFVLMIDGQWIVVDSGVCEYEPGRMRTYVRSTAAHNTVIVDGAEQSEVWGEFRVGRRARSRGAWIKRDDNTVIFDGAYCGFSGLNVEIVHRRRAALTLTMEGTIQQLAVTDQIESGDSTIRETSSLLHLDPDLSVERLERDGSGTAFAIRKQDLTTIATLSSTHGIQNSAQPSWFCPEFGVANSNVALGITVEGILPVQLTYELAVHRKSYVTPP